MVIMSLLDGGARLTAPPPRATFVSLTELLLDSISEN